MLRTLKKDSDEGCDAECPLCGRWCLYGTCSRCGYTIPCCGCGQKSTGIYVNDCEKHLDFIRMCDACAEQAFEVQNDDASNSQH